MEGKQVPPTADTSIPPRSCSFHFLKLSSSFEKQKKKCQTVESLSS